MSRFETQVQLGETDTGWAMNILLTIDSGTRDISVRLNLSRATLVSYFDYNFDGADGGVFGSVPIVDKQNDVITVALHSATFWCRSERSQGIRLGAWSGISRWRFSAWLPTRCAATQRSVGQLQRRDNYDQ